MDLSSAKSVAVLAFANLSDDKENEYFSDGISEELLNVLAKVPGLRVAARTSAFYFKGKNATAQEIGQKLGVAHLVDGSVRKAGTRVRIAARVSRSDTGEQLWSESYERELKDIFALQDEIARDIAAKLQVTLGGVAPRREVNPEAHRLVLEARHLWYLRTPEALQRAEETFKRALALDPRFARAHAGLADTCIIQAIYRQQEGLENYADYIYRARAAAQAALQIDPTLGEAYPALGYASLLEGKFAEAEREMLKALPPESHLRGFVLVALGRLPDALPFLERTPFFQLRWFHFDRIFDPFRDDPRFHAVLAKLGCAGQYKVARETLARMLREEAKK